MKNLKIILSILTLIIISSCGDNTQENNLVTNSINSNNSNINQELEQTENDVERIENKVYEEVVDKEEGLKNATSEELDAILQEEIRLLNTPSSEYLFFEQASTKKATIEEIKASGGMEITRGSVYKYGENPDYGFIYELLLEVEEKYTFYQGDNTFFYIEEDSVFINMFEEKYPDHKIIFEEDGIKDISFKEGGKEYFINFVESSDMMRDDIDNILGLNKKIKVSIFKGE